MANTEDKHAAVETVVQPTPNDPYVALRYSPQRGLMANAGNLPSKL